MGRQDVDHSYFKRSPQVSFGGRVGEGNDDGSNAYGEVGSPHTSEEGGESQRSKGGDGLRSAGSQQLSFALADSPSGDRGQGPHYPGRIPGEAVPVAHSEGQQPNRSSGCGENALECGTGGRSDSVGLRCLFHHRARSGDRIGESLLPRSYLPLMSWKKIVVPKSSSGK